MLDEDVPAADHGEDVVGLSGPALQPGLRRGHPFGRLEVGAVEVVKGVEPAQVEQSLHPVDVLPFQLQLADHQVEVAAWEVRVDLETGRATLPAAPAELGLDRREEVFGLALDEVEVGIPGDPEGVGVDDLHAREERLHVEGDQLLEGEEAAVIGKRGEAGQQRRHLKAGEVLDPAKRVADDHREVEREVRDVGKGMGRVDRKRGQDREDVLVELRRHVLALRLAQRIGGADPDPGHIQAGGELIVEDAHLPIGERLDPAADSAQLLGRGGAVDCRGSDGGVDLLLEARYADLEELVEALAEDGEEVDAVEQR